MFKENEPRETVSVWEQTKTGWFWAADSEHGFNAIPVNLQRFLLKHFQKKEYILYANVCVWGCWWETVCYSYWPPAGFLSPLNLQMVESSQLPLHIRQKTGRHVAAWSQSCPCICSIWLSHRNMIYIAFCRQESCPLLQCWTFRLILLSLGTGRCCCLGQIGSKTHGNSSSYTSEITSLPSASWDEIKIVSDKMREQI